MFQIYDELELIALWRCINCGRRIYPEAAPPPEYVGEFTEERLAELREYVVAYLQERGASRLDAIHQEVSRHLDEPRHTAFTGRLLQHQQFVELTGQRKGNDRTYQLREEE